MPEGATTGPIFVGNGLYTARSGGVFVAIPPPVPTEKLVFSEYVGGRSDVAVVNADGTGYANPTSGFTGIADKLEADWSPDGIRSLSPRRTTTQPIPLLEQYRAPHDGIRRVVPH